MKMHKASEMQLKAIMHGEGPARVLAGPGSGKTFTIIQRINYLITHYQIPPDKILCVTFTKAAALEMEQRFYLDFKQDDSYNNKNVCFATLHSLCYQILKVSGDFYQYSLVSEVTKCSIIKQLLANEGIVQDADYDMISDILSVISKRKNVKDTSIPVCLTEEQFEKIQEGYQIMLKERRLMDFDDMISCAYQLLYTNQKLCSIWQQKYSYILVDEFQDVNESQYLLIKLLAKPQNNLFIVGDDDQSIYGFRGAMPGIMKQFAADYREMKQLYLTENYRSGKEIVFLAAQMIKENKDRLSKTSVPLKRGGKINIFFREDRRGEEQLLVKHLKELTFAQQTESAVIVRTNREVFQYRALLKRAGIVVREIKKQENNWLHHFITEDIRAFLQFIKAGRSREDFFRFMNKPERYIVRQPLTEQVVKEEQLLRYYQKNEKMCKSIHTLFTQLDRVSRMKESLAIRYFRQVMGYDAYLEEKAKSTREREEWIMLAGKLQEIFRKKKQGENIDVFLRRMDGEQNQPFVEKNTEVKGVSIMTMHGVKGLEFTYVFLPDLNEGVIPEKTCKSKESIEEERRLLYVAITRAKESLFLYYTKERNRKPTRFLKDILERNS